MNNTINNNTRNNMIKNNAIDNNNVIITKKLLHDTMYKFNCTRTRAIQIIKNKQFA